MDRGQLVLVTGLALAVVLVALVLLANTAIYTENLATRDNGVGEHDALGYRASVIDGVGGIVERENAAEYDDRSELTANVSDGVATFDDLLRGSAARGAAGARADTDAATYVNGTLVRHTDDTRAFESNQSTSDWTVVGDTEGVRAFVATVDRASLATTEADSLSGAFTVVVDNGTERWRAYLYRNASTDHVAVAVRPPGAAGASEVCSVDAVTATVDFTRGTLAGDPCRGLDWAAGTSGEFDLRFDNGTNAVGTYDLTAESRADELVLATVNPDPVGGSPYHVPAVYAVEIPIRYQTTELVYGETVRVAPGEHDD
ncbi:hypothetical protein [Halobaculum marinum]|uniref:Flagellin n=1 Tax=Halobaculum marinum TaxID=3031996 RepID=A0ABD5X472_9EURY|nr:hypothetical protein [Halobaculum sp. DT55]